MPISAFIETSNEHQNYKNYSQIYESHQTK
jgi:hypothetical protein